MHRFTIAFAIAIALQSAAGWAQGEPANRYGSIAERPDTLAASPYDSPASPAATPASVAPTPRTIPTPPAPAATPATAVTPAPAARGLVPVTDVPGGQAVVTRGSGSLPNDAGQVWREYDIRPYTGTSTSPQPEQVLVDWVLRETGPSAWHGEPFGILSASKSSLRVYHTPQMQAMVADIVDRFVAGQSQAASFSIRVVTIESPAWRVRALPMMRPVPVESPGVQGWLLAKESATMLLADLAQRTDFREYSSPQQMVSNAQSLALSTMRPRTYVRGVLRTPGTWPGFQPDSGTLEEGFQLEFSPLLALDRRSADAMLKLRLCQVERMLPVRVEVPTAPGIPSQRIEIEVPQLTMANVSERFRWPVDQVLLLSMGVVATPGPAESGGLGGAIPMLASPPRADALVLIEARAAGSAAPGIPAATVPSASTATRPIQSFLGRY